MDFMDFCFILVPFGHYDEPEILRYAKHPICPRNADGRHQTYVRSFQHEEAASVTLAVIVMIVAVEAINVALRGRFN